MNCYGSKEVLAILNRVCLRNGEQQDFKIKRELGREKMKKKILDTIKEEEGKEVSPKPPF